MGVWLALGGCGTPAPEPPTVVGSPGPVLAPEPPRPSAAGRLEALQRGWITLPEPGDPARIPPALRDRLDAFATVDLPRLGDPALDAWPRDLVLSAAGLALLEPLSLVQDALPPDGDALAYLPGAVRASPAGRELLGHLAARLDPAHLGAAGRRADLPADVASALDDLPEILGDDLGALCGPDPVPTVRLRVLTALLEADAEIAEVPGMLDVPPDTRDPWRWVPAASTRCGAKR